MNTKITFLILTHNNTIETVLQWHKNCEKLEKTS